MIELKIKKIYFALFFMGLLITSCGGGEPQTRATDLCSCMKDTGMDFEELSQPKDLSKLVNRFRKLSKKKRSNGAKCFAKVLKEIKKDMKDMKSEEKATYMRELSKELIDTECGIDASKNVDSDQLDDLLDKLIKRMENNIDKGDRAYDDY